jgi:hypothetical protein
MGLEVERCCSAAVGLDSAALRVASKVHACVQSPGPSAAEHSVICVVLAAAALSAVIAQR